MSTIVENLTPDELLRMSDGKDYELIDGQLKERSISVLTSFAAARLIVRLGTFVEAQDAGWVLDSENGYRCFGENSVRRPDVSFVTKSRLPASEIGRGWMTIIPDLAVEIVSPNDNAHELQDKLEDYRAAEIPVVWVIYPESGAAWVHHSDGTSRHLVKDVELVGEGPLEGFRCPLASLLPASD